MWQGALVGIHIADEKAGPMRELQEAHLRAGIGIAGDRYALREGTFSKKPYPDREVTLVETEALTALARDYNIQLAAAETRRNLATRNVPLNHLVGKRFRVGTVLLEGIRLCEPCGHLAKLTDIANLVEGLRHRGGLRCQILSDGVIRLGEAIRPEG